MSKVICLFVNDIIRNIDSGQPALTKVKPPECVYSCSVPEPSSYDHGVPHLDCHMGVKEARTFSLVHFTPLHGY